MPEDRSHAAARLIDWTGERLVPWTDEAQTVYEHFHRYRWAASLVARRRVLDLGSGEGYGTAMLAGEAASVLGVDIDREAVVHSRLHYDLPNLEFRVGSMLALEEFDAGSFDAVVGFEVIEHVQDHDRVLDGVSHVLAADGLLILSTPERRLYSEATGFDNPYHEHELTQAELRELLGARFSHVSLWGQRAISGSWLNAIDETVDDRSSAYFVERSDEVWALVPTPPPVYLIAVASNAAAPAAPRASVLGDAAMEAAARWQRAATSAEHRAGRESARAGRESARAEHLSHDLRVMTADRDRLERKLAELLAKHDLTRAQLTAEIGRLQAELCHIHESVTWSFLERARALIYRATGGRNSRRGRALGGLLRAAGRVLPSR